MNFADYLKNENKKEKEDLKEKFGMDPFTEWSKVLTPKDVADAMCAVAGELAEEGGSEILLVNILLTTETIAKLFPREEFFELMKQRDAEMKGEK